MITGITFNQFNAAYYEKAMQVADITIAKQIQQHGQIHPSIDVENVKTLGVLAALEKTYNTYDVDKVGKASVKTYLSLLVHNCVLTELGKESTAVGAKKKRSLESFPEISGLDKKDQGKAFREYMQYDGRYERKEELIAEMMRCVRKLNAVDQVIIQCWLRNQKTYTDDVLEELGWPEGKRGAVQTRKNRALAALRSMMGGQKPEYRDISLPSRFKDTDQDVTPKESDTDYNAIRRRRRAARAQITGQIDYEQMGEDMYKMLIG